MMPNSNLANLTHTSQIAIFWSWQLDSLAKDNRNFIEDCIERAVKQINKSDAILIKIDRDTKNVGGTPVIADTILTKIRSSDIFIWDATLVYTKPRPAPNPNVLLELGYAIAVLGDKRLIGIMNTAGRPSPGSLPFDLKHRRWPIQYSLRSPTIVYKLLGRLFDSIAERHQQARQETRKKLVDDIAQAIKDALKEPKHGAIHSDVDLHATQRLWKLINSSWLQNWHQRRTTYPQYEESEFLDAFRNYIHISNQPENTLQNEPLLEKHEKVIESLRAYLRTTAIEMVMADAPGSYMISTKRYGSSKYIEDYDTQYERQVDLITQRAEEI
jgi:hypothetical protein